MSTPTSKSLKAMSKVELIAEAERLQAIVDSLNGELAAYRPAANGRKLDTERADAIRKAYIEGASKNALSLRYQVSRDTVDAVLSGTIYKTNHAAYIEGIHARKASTTGTAVLKAEPKAKQQPAPKAAKKVATKATLAPTDDKTTKAKELAAKAQAEARRRREVKDAEAAAKLAAEAAQAAEVVAPVEVSLVDSEA